MGPLQNGTHPFSDSRAPKKRRLEKKKPTMLLPCFRIALLIQNPGPHTIWSAGDWTLIIHVKDKHFNHCT